MTFEEYWNSCCDFHKCDECGVTVECAVDKAIAQSAWEAALPKWTYCKDGMPEEDIDSLVLQHNSFQPLNLLVEDKFNGEIRVVQGVYHFRIPCFATDDGEVIVHDGIAENDELKVLAWMPLPEVPND